MNIEKLLIKRELYQTKLENTTTDLLLAIKEKFDFSDYTEITSLPYFKCSKNTFRYKSPKLFTLKEFLDYLTIREQKDGLILVDIYDNKLDIYAIIDKIKEKGTISFKEFWNLKI